VKSRFYKTFLGVFALAVVCAAEPPVVSCVLPEFVNQLAAIFLHSETTNFDSHLRLSSPIRGEPVKLRIEVKGEPIFLYRKLGSGGDGDAYLGIKNGTTVVVKRLKYSTSDLSFKREVVLTRHLPTIGVRVAGMMGSYPTERVVVKEFVAGFYEEDLEQAQKSGKLGAAEVARARESLKVLQKRLREYRVTKAFRDFAASEGIPPYIDDDASNFLYSGGEWVLVDP
jgi:hypothetical protein